MSNLRFTAHALERMFERGISPKECEAVLEEGKTIEEYPDDQPFPSEIRLGFVGSRPIHLVVSFDRDTVHVITAYEPTLERWEKEYTVRKRIEND